MTQQASEANLPATPSAERRVQDLQIILDVARAMAGTMVLDDLLVLILDGARRLLHAERATLFMYDPESHELFSRFTHDTGEIRFSADLGIAGAVAKTRQTLNIPDAYADSRFNREIDRATGFRTRCMVTIPLIGLDDRLVGVMQVLNKTGSSFSPYDEGLGEALAAQAAVAIQRSHLLDHYVEKKQLERSLAIAREIQQSLFPKKLPQVPGYDIAGWSQPADETGGDCLDFVMLPDQRIAITLADVSGHGIGPALIMAETRALLRAIAPAAGTSALTLQRVNSWLWDDLSSGRFVTAFFGMLDPGAHRLDYASAGHGPLLWYRASSKQVSDTSSTGMPLGLMEPTDIEAAPSVHFEPGDMGIFLTDGFIEAQDPHGGFFGMERLNQLIVQNAHQGAAEVIRALEQAVRAFIAGGRQLDDLTAIVVKRL
jgi:phosphoserine phosphatase